MPRGHIEVSMPGWGVGTPQKTNMACTMYRDNMFIQYLAKEEAHSTVLAQPKQRGYWLRVTHKSLIYLTVLAGIYLLYPGRE